MAKLWQVSAGASGRNYADLFLRYGVMCVGSQEALDRLPDVEKGHRILLKRGVSEVVAVGVATSRGGVSQRQNPNGWWTDIDGWTLEGLQVVDWHVPPEPVAVDGLSRGTLQRSHKDHLSQLADEIITEFPVADAEPFPEPVDDIKDFDVIDFLISQGLRPRNAEELTVTLDQIRMLARHYYDRCDWSEVREHETRTFLVVPLLIALGWSEQQMKIELPVAGRQRADIACFRRPVTRDRPDSDCELIVETKGLKSGLTYAGDQARAYAAEYPECSSIVVSNGFCYRLFLRSKGGFQDSLDAYVNLLRPKERFPLDPEKGGGLQVFSALMPNL